jgi:hypothetical protein
MATLAQESFDILTLLPTYIENTKDAIAALANDTKVTKMGAGVNVFDKQRRMNSKNCHEPVWLVPLN